MPEITLSGKDLRLADLPYFLSGQCTVKLGPSVPAAMEQSLQTIRHVTAQKDAVYGVNTGFGALANRRIASHDLSRLQYNLVRSHASGIGSPLPDRIVRLMILLKANSLAAGQSGVRSELVTTLIQLLNSHVTPRIPERGSVGASGDLAPLAHLALALIGEGEATHQDTVLQGQEVLEAADLKPLVLEPKEGLALLNGTQLTSALALDSLLSADRLLRTAIVAGALSIECLAASHAPFDPRIHEARGQRGQIAVAAAFRSLLGESSIWQSHRHCERVQDPYSTRCQPQVLGAVWDTVAHAATILTREMNGVTDNPLVFGDEVLSGGNFHAEPVAFISDFLAIAVSEIGSLAERRIDTFMRSVNPVLPPFLASEAGLESGFMIAHVAAASLASENKTLAHPASVDTVPTSAGQEDHVSMGPWAGLKLVRIVENVSTILAIELLVAAAALDLQRPLQCTEKLEKVYRTVRLRVPARSGDQRPDRLIAVMRRAVEHGEFAVLMKTWDSPLSCHDSADTSSFGTSH